MKALTYAAVLLLAASPVLADDLVALSTTATAITGDISMDDFEMVFANGEKIEFDELVGDHFVVDGEDVPASVYSVKDPSVPELLNGNTLCGASAVTYVASWAADDVTIVAMFDTQDVPQSSGDMCASFSYVYP